jgi:hypothetical protein
VTPVLCVTAELKDPQLAWLQVTVQFKVAFGEPLAMVTANPALAPAVIELGGVYCATE